MATTEDGKLETPTDLPRVPKSRHRSVDVGGETGETALQVCQGAWKPMDIAADRSLLLAYDITIEY